MNRLVLIGALLASSCAPQVSIKFTSPAADTIVASKTTLSLSVDGVDNLAHVDVSASGTRIARIGRDDLFASSQLSVPWDPSNVAAGDVVVTATAVDLGGNSVAKATLAVVVHRGIGTPSGESGEGEGSAGEGEGSVVVVGEGEGEGSSTTNPDPTWTPPAARAFSKVEDWPMNSSTANPGNLNMYLYVPTNLPRHAPVVVAMHGCTQTADAFHSTTRWDDLADQYKFYVIYPEQNAQDDSAQTGNSMHCFNWAGYYGAKMNRGEGENESIKEMVDRLTTSSTYQADSHRVFATGLSAGGAMVPLLLATWPDVFSAGAPMAGVPYGCAHDINSAISCMHADPSTEQTPAQWASLVKAAGPSSWSGPYPRVSVWQGDADNTVSYGNMKRIVEQWTAVHGASQTPTMTDTLNGQAHATYQDASGHVVVETVTLHGMDHGISVDPGTGADQGGSTGAYAYNEGVWSTYYAAKFFGIVDGAVSSGEGEGEGSIAGEGEGEGSSSSTCVAYSTTLVMHEWAIPPRVKDVGTVLAPSYVVIGSNEVIPSTTNPYLATVTLHSTGDTTFALGDCP